jgi:putative peptidoglycan lipid II flippase
VRVFYARQNSATPFYLGLVTVLVNIGLSFLFSKTLGVAGLALAFSIANILNFVLLWIWLYFSVGTLDLGKIIISVLKFTVSAIGAGLVTQIMKVVIWPFIDMTTFVGVFTQLVVCGLSGTLVYLLLCLLLKSEELFRFIASLQNRWPLKKIKLGDQGEARGV